MQIILPSDQRPIEVQILPLFALDHIGPHDPGDFTYRVKTLLGETLDQPYPFEARLKNPPPEPKKDEDDTWILTEWERWQAALAHNQKRHEIAQERALNVAHEILSRCVEDRQRILTPADYDAVYRAAVPEEVREEHIAQALGGFFQGQIQWTGDTGGAAPLWGIGAGHRHGPSDVSGVGDRTANRAAVDYSGLFPYSGFGTGADDTGPSEQGEQMAKPAGYTQAAKAANPLSLIAGLIFYEQRQCQALGYSSSRSLRQWLFYYGRLRRQTERYAQAMVLERLIEATRGQVVRILIEAQTSTEAKKLLKEAARLNRSIKGMRVQCQRLLDANNV